MPLKQQNKAETCSSPRDEKSSQEARSATDALIEMGVKTGLSLIFSLLRQQWTFSSLPGVAGILET